MEDYKNFWLVATMEAKEATAAAFESDTGEEKIMEVAAASTSSAPR